MSISHAFSPGIKNLARARNLKNWYFFKFSQFFFGPRNKSARLWYGPRGPHKGQEESVISWMSISHAFSRGIKNLVDVIFQRIFMFFGSLNMNMIPIIIIKNHDFSFNCKSNTYYFLIFITTVLRVDFEQDLSIKQLICFKWLSLLN